MAVVTLIGGPHNGEAASVETPMPLRRFVQPSPKCRSDGPSVPSLEIATYIPHIFGNGDFYRWVWLHESLTPESVGANVAFQSGAPVELFVEELV